MNPKRLEDLFAGAVELTASERALVLHALTEWYMRGGANFPPHNRRELYKSVAGKLSGLKLHRMVTPDGSRLVSVEEHEEIVAKLYPVTPPVPDDWSLW